MNTTDTRPNTTFSSVMLPRDFSSKVTDPLRDTWTRESLGAVVDALDGARVAVTTDKMTGHTQMGVTFGAFRPTPGFGGYQVLIRDYYTENGEQVERGTWYSLHKLGMILPLDEALGSAGVKWTAIRAHAAAGA